VISGPAVGGRPPLAEMTPEQLIAHVAETSHAEDREGLALALVEFGRRLERGIGLRAGYSEIHPTSAE
jgi:hypothetical protein